MTVRYLAEELYRWTREVEDLEKTLAALEPGSRPGGAGPVGDGAPPGQTATGPFPGRPDVQKGPDQDIIFAVTPPGIPPTLGSESDLTCTPIKLSRKSFDTELSHKT